MMLRASIDPPLSAPIPTEETELRARIVEQFVDAVVGDDPVVADEARATLIDRLGADSLIDVAAVIANFEMMTRLADATGARLRPEQIEAAASVIEEFGLDAFPSART